MFFDGFSQGLLAFSERAGKFTKRDDYGWPAESVCQVLLPAHNALRKNNAVENDTKFP